MTTHSPNLTATANLSILPLLLGRIALSPTITLTLHLLLTHGPASLRSRLLTTFPSLRRARNFAALLATLKILCGVGAVGAVNERLNVWARRRWHWRQPGGRFDFGGVERGEVVVVTGGCGGFGRGIVAGLVGRCRVVVLDVGELPEEFEGRAGLYYYRCDLTSPTSIATTCAAIRSDAGDPTVLINNAGLVSKLPILETSTEELERLFRVNLLSHWTLVQEFLPAMLERGKGHVVSVASTASFVSGSFMASYCASKAGLLAFHEALSAELNLYPGGNTIRTTILHPMWAATPMLRDWQPVLEARRTPILDPADVYNRIVAQVLKGESAQIFCPEATGIYAGLRGCPAWVQEWVREMAMGKLERPGRPGRPGREGVVGMVGAEG